MATLKQIAASTKSLQAYLDKLSKREKKALIAAIKTLEQRIVKLVDKLEREDGRLVSTQVNLKQAQALHAQIGTLVDSLYGGTVARYVRKDLARVVKRSEGYLSAITGEPQKFAGVDKTFIRELTKLNLAQFETLGSQSVDRVAKAMYEHLIGGNSFNSLKKTIRGVLTGHKDVLGRPMTKYAGTMTQDTVRNFSNQVILAKADEIGLTSFVYYGDLIESSRKWCRRHAGKVFTEAEIAKLDKQTWAGKSGPWRTHRGGYRCRHGWVPVRAEWVAGRSTEVQDYFTET